MDLFDFDNEESVQEDYNSNDFRDEIFRINCVEISSELLNPKYEEYPILFVDNALDEKQQEEYEDYIQYGRNGMPNWKDYYAIKNLVETLQEIDGLDNKDAINVLKDVEEGFIRTLFARIQLDIGELRNPMKAILFSVLQKAEFFYPEDDRLLQFLLRVDSGETTKKSYEGALDQYKTIFQDDHYFQNDEKLLVDILLGYFNSDKKAYNHKMKTLQSDRLKDKLQDFLLHVQMT